MLHGLFMSANDDTLTEVLRDRASPSLPLSTASHSGR